MSVTEIPRVVVAQIGARRNYAVPIALEKAGLLEKLYTDWYAPKNGFTAILRFVSDGLRIPILQRAVARKTADIPPEKVVHFPSFAVAYKWKKYVAARRSSTPLAYIWGGETFCKQVSRRLPDSPAVVFAFSSAAKEIFEVARERGAVCFLDQGIPPLTYDFKLVQEQEEHYQAWVGRSSTWPGVNKYTERQQAEWAVADIILCPSSFCYRGLEATGAPLEKVRMLPFGIVPGFYCAEPRLADAREFVVLFAGNSPIRKGLPDFVIALELLGRKNIRGVVAGDLSSLSRYGIARTARICDVLGPVPRPQVARLYQEADVFVFPTVSDVFPAVVLEAMASGIPVITTDQCGAADVIRDGVDGFLVPVRSPEKIAERLERLMRDRELLCQMGRNARDRAMEFTLEKYRDGLVALIRQEITQLKSVENRGT